MTTVSIIVPMYNCEKTIKKCLNSIVNQTYKNLEIILINDGSTDSTIDKVNTFKDPRIKLINITNHGVSYARNLGIDNSNGEYIMFVDSDDFISLDCVYTLMNIILKNNYKIIQFEFAEFTNYSDIKYQQSDNHLNVISGREANLRLVEAGSKNYSIVWNKIYHKNVFLNLRFKENIRYEDEDILYKIYSNQNQIAILNNTLYFYYTNPNSFMNTTNKHTLDFIKVFEDKINFFINTDIELALRTENILCYYFIKTIAYTNDKTIKSELIKEYKRYAKRFTTNEYITGLNKLAVHLINVSPIFFNLYKLKNIRRNK